MKHIWDFLSGGGAGAARGERRIPWEPLEDIRQLDAILEQSRQRPQLIFKHSTRCGISAVMLRRLEQNWQEAQEAADFHFLDILSHRDVSQAVSERIGLPHQSPQVLLIREGDLFESASHSGISGITP